MFVTAALATKPVVFLRLRLSDVSSKLFEFDTVAATSAYDTLNKSRHVCCRNVLFILFKSDADSGIFTHLPIQVSARLGYEVLRMVFVEVVCSVTCK